MTRPPWPLSREAVEAAAREMWPASWDSAARLEQPDVLERMRTSAAKGLRAAIAAWVPSEGQEQVAAEMYGCMTFREALLAAVRTEAAE